MLSNIFCCALSIFFAFKVLCVTYIHHQLQISVSTPILLSNIFGYLEFVDSLQSFLLSNPLTQTLILCVIFSGVDL